MRYETFTWAIYQQYQSAFDRSIAAVLSLVLIGLAVGLLLIELYSRGRQRYYRVGAGASRVPQVFRLGLWKWAASGFCASVVLTALVLPVGVLLYWLVRGFAADEPVRLLWGAMRNSLYVSGLAAFIAAACALPVAGLVVRYPGLISRLLERASYIGFALPGVVVALALVFFGTKYAQPAYQTVWLLVFGYLVLFLPAALGAVRSSLLQVSPRLEDAARGLGRRPLQVMRAVTVPLMWPGVLMGAVLVFLITMKELPATLILGPLGFKTLATAIWSNSSEAFFARAALPALTLILLSSVPMVFIVIRGRHPYSTGERERWR
jgi:iron(III) transport system permease protein